MNEVRSQLPFLKAEYICIEPLLGYLNDEITNQEAFRQKICDATMPIWENFNKIKKLGKGDTSKVYQVQEKQTGKHFALKKFLTREQRSEQLKKLCLENDLERVLGGLFDQQGLSKQAAEEFQIASLGNHPTIMKIYALFFKINIKTSPHYPVSYLLLELIEHASKDQLESLNSLERGFCKTR